MSILPTRSFAVSAALAALLLPAAAPADELSPVNVTCDAWMQTQSARYVDVLLRNTSGATLDHVRSVVNWGDGSTSVFVASDLAPGAMVRHREVVGSMPTLYVTKDTKARCSAEAVHP